MTTNLPALLPQTDAALLPASLLPRLSFETRSIRGSDGQYEGEQVCGCTITTNAADNPTRRDAALREALASLQSVLRPCGGETAIKALALLRSRTKARSEDAAGTAMTAAAYGDWLAQYPADIAAAACEEWARGNVFWPAWVELQRIADRLVAPRLAIRKALQEALAPKAGVLYLGKPPEETRAQRMRATINAYLRTDKVFDASRVERTLATEEGRTPEDWATAAREETSTQRTDMPSLGPKYASSEARAAWWASQGVEAQKDARHGLAEGLEGGT